MRKPKHKPAVPDSLRTWFIVHFIVDVIFGLPLLAVPDLVLPYLGWTVIDPLAARLVGAALLGIGIESYLGRDAGVAVYRGMLNLKIVWASAASLGILLSLFLDDAPAAGWLFLGLFVIFDAAWIYYRNLLRHTA